MKGYHQLLTGIMLFNMGRVHSWSHSATLNRRLFRTRSASVFGGLPSYQHHQTVSGITSHSALPIDPFDENYFLSQVEETIDNVQRAHPGILKAEDTDTILQLPATDREAMGVARHLQARLTNLRKNRDCPRCWLQRAHCICSQCGPAPQNLQHIRRIFLVMHHKEVGLKVDTAKLILAAFPEQSRLVVGGISSKYQSSMKEMEEAIDNQPDHCLVLFPDDSAQTYPEIQNEIRAATGNDYPEKGWDLIVLDGTWAQARKLYLRNFPTRENGGPRRLQLGAKAVAQLADGSEGHQLRRHDTFWRQVGTFEATRLCLHELVGEESRDPILNQIETYQEIANAAARRELGPPRVPS